MKPVYIIMIILFLFCIAGLVIAIKMNKKSKKIQAELEEKQKNR